MGIVQELLGTWLQRNPGMMRVVFGAFQRYRPLPVLGSRAVIVTRADDAREVLARADEFEIGPLNGAKMMFGPFVLGLDPYPRYLREHGFLKGQLDASVEPFGQISRAVVERHVAALRARLLQSQSIDAVRDFAERVTTDVAAEFFGVPTVGATSRVLDVPAGPDTLRLWLRKLGSTIASSVPAPFGLQAVARACTPELVAHVGAALERAKHASSDSDVGLLSHWAALQRSGRAELSDELIVRNVIGLMLAGSAAITKAFAHSLDQLLRRPEHLQIAVTRAQKQDDVLLLESVREALRFNPTFPLLSRFCPRETTLAAGTPRQIEVPAGASVYVATVSAMFDPEAVERPDVFGYGRDDEATYLHFGFGTHRCLGKRQAEAELLEMFRAFLTLPGIATAAPGKLGYDGPAVDRYSIRPDSRGESRT